VTKLLRHGLAIVVAGLVTLMLVFMAQGSIESLGSATHDMVWRILSGATQQQSERRIIVVNIDEASIETYGPWPWPRPLMAKLVQRLKEEGAALEIFDVVFPSAQSGDAVLAQALATSPTVLAQILAIDSDEAIFRGRLQSGLVYPDCQRYFDSASAYIANDEKIVGQAAGHITPRISLDGSVRKMPAMICYQDKVYAALALAAVAKGAEVAPAFSYQINSSFWESFANLQYLHIPGMSIPVDANGDILLPWWLARQEMVSISAKAVLQGEAPPGFLSGAWALVGATAFGIGDAVPTPLGGAVSGVEVHAQLLSAILDGRIPFQAQSAGLLQLLWALVMAGALWLATCYLNRGFLVGMLLVAVGLMAVTALLPLLLLQLFSLWLPMVTVILFVFIASGFVLIQQYYCDRHEKALMYRNLASYLPEHVALKIATVEPSSKLQARHERVVVLYADLRNFSAWCNQLPADEVGAILHSFYSLADQVVSARGGVIEEYVGDAVLAVWYHDTCVDCAPVRAAQTLVKEWEVFFGHETYQDNLPPLAVGGGIDYGDVLVGSFGSEHRRAYTLLGETVSKAMRIQAMTEELAQPVVLSENAHMLWGRAIVMHSLGDFWLSGAQKASKLFYPESDI
jgi:adenylate cyclase